MIAIGAQIVPKPSLDLRKPGKTHMDGFSHLFELVLLNWHARLFVRREFPPPFPGSVLLVESSEDGGSRRRHCFFRMP